ncbi:MAG: hypothetical protein R3E31_28765 [Chloroflexota bacterium]
MMALSYPIGMAPTPMPCPLAAGFEMPGPARWMNPEKIVAQIKAGELDEAVIDDKVRRLSCFDGACGAFAPQPPVVVDEAADSQLARTVAAEAIVLLKNEG